MKRIWFAAVIAYLAVSGNAQADNWGRNWKNPLVSQTVQKSDAPPTPIVEGPVQGPVQNGGDYSGYPFESRCGANSNCCANVWDGYTGSCWPCCNLFGHHGNGGCGGGKLFGHHLGLHGHCGSSCGGSSCGGSSCDSCGTADNCGCNSGCGGGCFNSFGGGGSCGGLGGWGLGLHHGKHGCGCGHHLFGGLRQMCGLDCGCDMGGSEGCSSCGGNGTSKSDQYMSPPATPAEPVPAAPNPVPEKSAFRPWTWNNNTFSFNRTGF